MSDDLGWQELAECLNWEPDVWFPLPGDKDAAEHARRICQGCPVIADCLDYAIETDARVGIWGGENVWRRRRIAKTRRRTA